MVKDENKNIFDGVTILLIVILFVLIATIFGITYWKEQKINLDFQFFSQPRLEKKSDQIIKNDRIVISFSGPVQIETVLNNLIIEPRLNFESNWINNHQLQLILKEDLIPDFNYRLKIKSFKSKWGVTNKEKEKIFSTDILPELKETNIVDGQTEMGIQEEFSFEFKKPLAKQYYLKIKTKPTFEFKNIETKNKNKIVIKPANKLSFDTEYQLIVEIKSRNYSDFSREIVKTSFKTERPPVVVYGWDNNGTITKTEDRINLAIPSITTGRYIDINLSEQNLYIFEDGREEGAYKVSTGLRGLDTPIGEFKIIAKASRPWSAKYGLFMPWFLQFTNQGHGIHELPEWSSGYKEGANHLGIPVSHGCVRLGVGPAKKVYDFVKIGTPIIIHY